MATAPHLPERRQSFWSAPKERIYISIIHWAVVLIVVVAILILALQHDLDRASITALYGTVLGHAGTSASQKLSNRSNDTRSGADPAN